MNTLLRRAGSLVAVIGLTLGLIAGAASPAEAAHRKKQAVTMTAAATHLTAGDTTTITGRLKPYRVGVTVAIQQRYVGAKKWTTIGHATTTAGGYYTVTITTNGDRDRYLRAHVTKTKRYKADNSPTRRLWIAAKTIDTPTVTPPPGVTASYSYEEEIPFETITTNDPTQPRGTTTVTTEGVPGLRRITIDNGTITASEVLVQPITKVVVVGTAGIQPTAQVTVCEVRTSGDASMAVVKAVVSDPDNVGYTVTLHINGRSVVSPPDSGDSQYSTQIQGATSAFGCSVTLS